MMQFNSTKVSISLALTKLTDTSEVNKIIIGCLVYEMISNILINDKKKNGLINTLADKYVVSFKGIVESLEEHYISYKEMTSFIKKENISSFEAISITQLNKIVVLYKTKIQIQSFNPKHYSQYMYNILYISEQENKRVRDIHFKVFAPLAEYFKTYKNIPYNSVKIEPVDFINRNYSKAFNISIKGITAAELYGEIMSNKCNIMDYIYKVNINSDGYITLILK